MFRSLLPIFALALAGCQGAVAWVTPTNELQYAFLTKDDATQIATQFNLGTVGRPTGLMLAFGQKGVGLGSCVETQRMRRGQLQYRNTLRLHDFEGDELIAWSDRELARALDLFIKNSGQERTAYERFITQAVDSYGSNSFHCWYGGPRQGKQDQLVIYVQPQFNTEVAALNVAVAFASVGRIRAAEIFGIGVFPTTVVADRHPSGGNVLSTTASGQILINGQPLRDPGGSAVSARTNPSTGGRAVGSVLK